MTKKKAYVNTIFPNENFRRLLFSPIIIAMWHLPIFYRIKKLYFQASRLNPQNNKKNETYIKKNQVFLSLLKKTIVWLS